MWSEWRTDALGDKKWIVAANEMQAGARTSLFCFSLMLPDGEEPNLLRWQYTERKSIFQCDHFAVYSDRIMDVGGLQTRVVETSLYAPIGGAWNTRLNTEIFIKLWKQVVADGVFRAASWSVKADPDAAFFPNRLKDIVATPEHDNAQHGAGMFLNNCERKGTLHGALEVLSRRAVEVWAAHSDATCVGNNHPPQEDFYMRICLIALGATQGYDWRVMTEQYCHWNWKDCTGKQASFHPFKTVDAYKQCISNAESSGAWTS